MEEINNLSKIKSFLRFKENTYYFVQVIQRRKENPDLPKTEIQRGFWYITSLSDLDIHWPKILMLCNVYNARAYISLVPRSLEKFGKQCLLAYSERVVNGSYKNIFSVPQKIALSNKVIDSKRLFDKTMWMIDIDSNKDQYKDRILNFIAGITKIHLVLKTPNGFHLVVDSFNPKAIMKHRIVVSRDDYKLETGEEFTLREESNTILYSNPLKSL